MSHGVAIDKEADEVLRLIGDFSLANEAAPFIVLAVMSHGNGNDEIAFKDRKIRLQEIVDAMKNDNLKQPKVMFNGFDANSTSPTSPYRFLSVHRMAYPCRLSCSSTAEGRETALTIPALETFS